MKTNYTTEGNIDFYKALLEDDDGPEHNDDECLISGSKLNNIFVTMDCGHKFNYIPLYKDLVNHKGKFNSLESTYSQVSSNQLRCPYCRHKQNKLLPYYEELGLPKVVGVNVPYEPIITSKCEYITPNPHFDPDMEETSYNFKYIKCMYSGSKLLEHNFGQKSTIFNNLNDTKCYCYNHKKDMVKQYKLEDKEKQKLAKLAVKQKIQLEKEKKITENKEKQKQIALITKEMKLCMTKYTALENSYMVTLKERNECMTALLGAPKQIIDNDKTSSTMYAYYKNNAYKKLNELNEKLHTIDSNMNDLIVQVTAVYEKCNPENDTNDENKIMQTEIVIDNLTVESADNDDEFSKIEITTDKPKFCSYILKSGPRKGQPCLGCSYSATTHVNDAIFTHIQYEGCVKHYTKMKTLLESTVCSGTFVPESIAEA